MGRGPRRGRGGGRGGKRQHSGDGDGGGGSEARNVRPRTDAWRLPGDIESSGLFEAYYQGQGVCPPEEWDAFILALKTPLPITFRINGRGQHADRLREKLETDFMAQFSAGQPLVIDGEPVEAPHPLDWYPDNLAWQMNFSRSQLRKQPVLEALHEFIKRENETGSITRQEAVSMVPPLFLDVEPHHWVLDMCAAPGSKTFQLLEALHAGPAPATGLVVANDADGKRCSLLTHQTKRMCSPALVVTNHEAQAFPLLRNLVPGAQERRVLFDRILCDVPCSGDGTMRKAPDIWRRWGTNSGNNLHTTQLRITLRACQLLRVGGRLVYSTCTFNPVEDEAVVAEVLRRTKGAFELVDGSDHLPGLRRVPGLQRWRVKDREGWYESWEEGKRGYKLEPSMFPDAASDALPLHRCMRFLPHHQDTGGFFVAVLRKVGELPPGPLEQVSSKHQREERKGQQQQAGEREEEEEEAGEEAAAGKASSEAAGEVEAEAAAEPMEAEGQQRQAAAAVKQEEAAAEVKQEEVPAAAAVKEAAAAAAAAGVKQEQGAAVKEEDEAAAAGEVKQEEGAAEAAKEEEGEEAKGGEAAPAEEQGGDGKSGKGWWQRQREAEAEAQAAKGLPAWGIRGGGARNRQEGGGRYRGVDPIVPFLDPQQLPAMRAFYGLAPQCPVPDALISRSTDPHPKKLYYVSPAVKLLLRQDAREQVKVTAAGVKILERQDSKDGLVPCLYRFAQDGLPALLPHVTRQRFHPTLDELLAVLKYRTVGLPEGLRVHITKGKQKEGQQEQEQAAAAEAAPAADAPAAAPEAQQKEQQEEQAVAFVRAEPAPEPAPEAEPAQPPPAAAEAAADTAQAAPRFTLGDPATLEQLRSVDMGCCVALMRAQDAAMLGFAPESGAVTEGGLAAEAPLAVACWRGRGSLNVLVSKLEAAQMVEKINEARAKAVAAQGELAAEPAGQPAAEAVAA